MAAISIDADSAAQDQAHTCLTIGAAFYGGTCRRVGDRRPPEEEDWGCSVQHHCRAGKYQVYYKKKFTITLNFFHLFSSHNPHDEALLWVKLVGGVALGRSEQCAVIAILVGTSFGDYLDCGSFVFG